MSHRSTAKSTDTAQYSSGVCEEIALAVLLVGGMGMRLRSVVPSSPKPLASIGNRSFLELLVQQLRGQGIRRLLMCTGYLGAQIETEFGKGDKWELAIDYSREPRPLGTAGALKLAQEHLRHASDFLVMNGDSFMEIDLCQLIRFHRDHRALVTMAVVHAQNASRYGTVLVNADSRVIGFTEKTGNSGPGLINAGVYVFNRAILERIPDGPASLEREVFPELIGYGIYALEQHGIFIDIGTPEDYTRARELCHRLREAAFRGQQSGSCEKERC